MQQIGIFGDPRSYSITPFDPSYLRDFLAKILKVPKEVVWTEDPQKVIWTDNRTENRYEYKIMGGTLYLSWKEGKLCFTFGEYKNSREGEVEDGGRAEYLRIIRRTQNYFASLGWFYLERLGEDCIMEIDKDVFVSATGDI